MESKDCLCKIERDINLARQGKYEDPKKWFQKSKTPAKGIYVYDSSRRVETEPKMGPRSKSNLKTSDYIDNNFVY
jgi:hypothetical protein